MKVCYVLMQFPVKSETFASNDVLTLVESGVDVSVFALRPKSRSSDSLIVERGLASLEIFHSSLFSFLYFIGFCLKHPVKLCKLLWFVIQNCKTSIKHLFKSFLIIPSVVHTYDRIINKSPDVVHLFWGHYPSLVGYLVLNFNKGVKLTTFLGAHDLTTRYPPSIRIANEADAVFTHSNTNLSLIKSIGVSNPKLYVCYRGTPLADYLFDFDKSQFLSNKFEVFATAARLIPEKGVDNVIKTFARYIESGRLGELYILGEGPELGKLIELSKVLRVHDFVFFLGHVDQNRVFDVLLKANFFLLLSEYKSERLPNVIKEAMVRGCICITTNTPGINELITDREDGFIVKGDLVVESLNIILDSGIDKKLICKNANGKILRDFDVRKNMLFYIDVWREILK